MNDLKFYLIVWSAHKAVRVATIKGLRNDPRFWLDSSPEN